MKILVIRFRQMGDMILATCLTNTLRKNFPHAQIDLVLNDRIAPLFEGHPSIDNIITFTNKERHSALTYIRKVWKIVHQTHYDIIIDMRSTTNTMLFALFSHSTPYRIGLKKGYTRYVFNHTKDVCRKDESMIDHDLGLLKPLEKIKPLEYIRQFTLHITEQEREDFKAYMEEQGIDFHRPIVILTAATRVERKSWGTDNFIWLLQQMLATYPDIQIIPNYAPGKEEEIVRQMYQAVGAPDNIFVDIQAKSPKELVAMSSLSCCFIGNEGGARHIAHAAGIPSFVICAPTSNKATWIPKDNVPSRALDVSDFVDDATRRTLTYEEQFKAITKERVWEELQSFMKEIQKR